MAGARAPRLSSETLLDIELSALCSRHRYTNDPVPVIAELRRRAGDRTDILAEVVGQWVGFYRDEFTAILADALEEIDGIERWREVGEQRRRLPPHKTP